MTDRRLANPSRLCALVLSALALGATCGATCGVAPLAAQDLGATAAPAASAQSAATRAADPATPSSPQPADPRLSAAAAAEAGLDFPRALALLRVAIEAEPDAPAPRLARARLHAKMQRPALALADLAALLARHPEDLDARLTRAEILAKNRAWAAALADLDAVLARAPETRAALDLRAEIVAVTGPDPAAAPAPAAAEPAPDAEPTAPGAPLAAAPADSDAPAAPTDSAAPPQADRPDPAAAPPGDTAAPTEAPTLAPTPAPAPAPTAEDIARAERTAAAVRFDPAAVMAPAQTVVEGAETAPNTLHIVHAATALDREAAGPDPAALDRALAAGALKVVHMVTYTGADASIWGALGLICAGPDGFRATHTALAGPDGQAALTAAGQGDRAPLAALLRATYASAGVDPDQVTGCALDRTRATRYLADWQSRSEAGAFRGVNLLDHWPVWVLNGTPLAPAALTARLHEIAPPVPAAVEGSDAEAPTEGDAGADTGTETPAPVEAAPPPADPAPNPAPNPPTPTTTPTTTSATTSALPEAAFPPRPAPAEDARVPVTLRGIYAPNLAACLAYLDSIAAPERLDTVLPALNPLDGPVLATVLVTSRRAYLFNALDTECAIAQDETADGAWQGRFTCTSPLSPDRRQSLTLAPAGADGIAPRIGATFGEAAPVVLRQCRALGQLGRSFAPLWRHDSPRCAVTAPLDSGTLTFSRDATGDLRLRVTPNAPPDTPPEATPPAVPPLSAALDGSRWPGPAGTWDGNAWQISLGPFEAAADRLGWGMFLDLRTAATGAAPYEARLPLFGSSAAMDHLATCAP